MSNAIACFKWVLDEEDIIVNPDQSVNYSRARYELSEYDKNAIEAAAQMAANLGGEAIGVTFAPDVPKQLHKDALSRNLDCFVYIKDEAAAGADAVVTAKALVEGIKSVADCAVVVCAEGAQDTFARQIPGRIAAALDLPLITSVASYSLEGNTLTCIRRLENCMQTVCVELPAVIAVLPEANDAPIPSMKAILAAGKKPIDEIAAGVDLTPIAADVSQKGFVASRKSIRIEGSPEEQAAQLKDILFKEGVL